MKKFGVLILTVVLLISLAFAGCQAATTTTAVTTSEEAPTKEEAVEKPVTITLAMHVAEIENNEPHVYWIAQEFMKKNPNITINLQGTPGDVVDDHIRNMKMAATSDTLPDMFWLLPAPALEMAKAGELMDLNEFINNNKDITDKILPSMITPFKLEDGTLYGIAYAPLITGFWVNKSILNKYNLEVPETYEQLTEVVKTLSENNEVPIAKGSKSSFSIWAFEIMLCRYGFFDKLDGILSGKIKYNNPDFLKLYQKIDELRKLGAFPDNVANMDYFQAVEMFIDGGAAMLDSGQWESGKMSEVNFVKDLEFWFGPTFSDGVGNQKLSMVVPAAPWVFSAKVKEDTAKYEALVKFLRFYYSEEGANLFIENGFVPTIEYDVANIDASKYPALSKVVEQVMKPGWESAENQPDLAVPEVFGNAIMDSMWGVINGVYTPEEALDVVDREIAVIIEK